MVPSPPTAAGFLGPSSFPGPAGHELGHSWQLLTPLLASAPQVTPGGLQSQQLEVRREGFWPVLTFSCLPDPGGPDQRPTPSLTRGLSGNNLGFKKKKKNLRQLPTGHLGQGSLLGGTSAPGRGGPVFSKTGQRLCRDRLRPGWPLGGSRIKGNMFWGRHRFFGALGQAPALSGPQFPYGRFPQWTRNPLGEIGVTQSSAWGWGGVS